MRKLVFMMFLLLVGTVWIAGCEGKKGQGDKEPNNSIEKAGEINLDESFPIKIHPKGDVDWFKVDLPEQGYLQIQVGEYPEELKPEVAFALYQEWEEKKENRIRGWNYLPDAVPIPEQGSYYFALKDDYDDASSEEAFQIKATFLKEFDPYEPNDTPEEAKLIKVGSVIKPAIYPVKDVDWFKVSLDEQGYLILKTNNVPREITPEVSYYVYDEWSDPKVERLRNWSKLPDACFIPDSGDYLIQLQDDYNDACSENPFDLKIEFLAEMDKAEPNDEFSDAKSINRGDTLSLAVFPRGDRDYYKINTGELENLKIKGKGFSKIVPEIKLQVLDEDNLTKLNDASRWKKLPAEFEVEKNKEYFIVIHDDYDDESSPEVFQLIVE